MTLGIDRISWELDALASALETASVENKLTASPRTDLPPPWASPRAKCALRDRMTDLADWLGVEAVPEEVLYGELVEFLRRGDGVKVLILGEGDARRVLIVTGARGSRARVWVPALRNEWVRVHDLVPLIRAELDDDYAVRRVEDVLRSAEVRPRQWETARRAILDERNYARRLGQCWSITPHPSSSFLRHFRHARLGSWAALFFVSYVVAHGLGILAWFVFGRGVLGGGLELGWLIAWLLLLVSLVPLQMVYAWAQARFSLGVGSVLKKRLMHGALSMDPDEVGQDGVGSLMARVLESEAVESLGLQGGFRVAFGVVDTTFAAAVLISSVEPLQGPLLLAGFVVVIALASTRYFARRSDWSNRRMEMSRHLIEQMAGHRTRLVQCPPSLWHDGEDEAHARYAVSSRDLDRDAVLLGSVLPNAWMIVALIVFAPGLLAHGAIPLAATVGGIILGRRGLGQLVSGIGSVSGAFIAWSSVQVIARACSDAKPHGRVALVTEPDGDGDGPLLQAAALSFSYPAAASRAIDELSLDVHRGDRFVLEGESGGGKSTLVSLLSGLRAPDSGVLLLHGLDLASLGGRAWRKRVLASSQFHVNHVFANTLAFNLLMGRNWPPETEDLEEAERTCRAIGLGPLLDRMPSGLMQVVGDTGWQLSHGEKSRVYVARALLQDPEILLLDESLGALDPATVKVVVQCVLDRVETLVLVAHP